ncbi:sigma-70 family RNA polymerase sigma factor [Leptospira yasudae]|uniref:RNA polymerase sigma factor n=1 Tax=Leptospira yasudae TaxID=2202201 RepID=UPI000E59C953|nr:sigma-70 family RNA polymerase sigma factor [Leptospira yasudae]RHX95545.1 sigma-70 family RNA polymerase sigma factor [Leptospira yasudae]
MSRSFEEQTFDFDGLYSRNYEKIYRFLLSKGASVEEAEEVCQETFIKVLRHWGNYDPEKGNETSWIITIAKNQFLDLVKKKNTVQNKEIDNSQSYLEAVATAKKKSEEEDEQLDLLRKEVEQLPELERKIIRFRFMQKCTIQETANSLGISVRTVNRKTYASLQVLRMKLQRADFAFEGD